MLERLKGYVQNPIFLFILWMGVGLACSLSLMMKGTYSNYVIFSQSFWHAISSSPLYVEYLQEQKDFFLYGISFTALISPFAVLPRPLGMVFWCLVNCGFLYYAISKLDLKKWQFAVVILVSVNDVFTAVLSQQYSIGITAMIIFSYVLIEKEKDFWAAFDDCIRDYDQTLWDSRTGFLFILETQNETRRRISLLGSDRFFTSDALCFSGICRSFI